MARAASKAVPSPTIASPCRMARAGLKAVPYDCFALLSSTVLARRGRPSGRPKLGPQENCELRAVRWTIRRHDSSTVQFNQMPDDGETETGAAWIARA